MSEMSAVFSAAMDRDQPGGRGGGPLRAGRNNRWSVPSAARPQGQSPAGRAPFDRLNNKRTNDLMDGPGLKRRTLDDRQPIVRNVQGEYQDRPNMRPDPMAAVAVVPDLYHGARSGAAPVAMSVLTGLGGMQAANNRRQTPPGLSPQLAKAQQLAEQAAWQGQGARVAGRGVRGGGRALDRRQIHQPSRNQTSHYAEDDADYQTEQPEYCDGLIGQDVYTDHDQGWDDRPAPQQQPHQQQRIIRPPAQQLQQQQQQQQQRHVTGPTSSASNPGPSTSTGRRHNPPYDLNQQLRLQQEQQQREAAAAQTAVQMAVAAQRERAAAVQAQNSAAAAFVRQVREPVMEPVVDDGGVPGVISTGARQTIVEVDNIAPDLGKKDVTELLSGFGRVLAVEMLQEKTEKGQEGGTAFVTMDSRKSALNAVRSLDGKELDGDGYILKVTIPGSLPLPTSTPPQAR